MSYRVEVSHKHVTILPQPLHDPALVAALKARFPESEGWYHFRYAVGRFAASPAAARALAEELRELGATK